MMKSKRNNDDASNKSMRKITRNSTCVDLFDCHEIACCCDACRPKLDPLSLKRKPKRSKNKEKSIRHRCLQPWLSSYATTASKTILHEKVCSYLSYSTELIIEDEYKYSSKSDSTTIKNTIPDKSEEKSSRLSKTSSRNTSPTSLQDMSKWTSSKSKFSPETIPKIIPYSKSCTSFSSKLSDMSPGSCEKIAPILLLNHPVPPKMSKEDDMSIDLPMPLLLKHPAPPIITVDNGSYDDSDVEILDDAYDSNNESEDEMESSLCVKLSKSEVKVLRNKSEIARKIKK